MDITKCRKKKKINRGSNENGRFLLEFPNFSSINTGSAGFFSYNICMKLIFEKSGYISLTIISNQKFDSEEGLNKNKIIFNFTIPKFSRSDFTVPIYYNIPKVVTNYRILTKSTNYAKNFNYTYTPPSFVNDISINIIGDNIAISFSYLDTKKFNIFFDDLTRTCIGFVNMDQKNNGVSGNGYSSTNDDISYHDNEFWCKQYGYNSNASNVLISGNSSAILFSKSNYIGFESGELVYFNCFINESNSINANKIPNENSVFLQTSFTIA
jgi:hypothetical protein